MSKQLLIVSEILDKCSPESMQDLFTPILKLPADSTKAEMIASCLNNELAAYGFKSYTSPDRSMILLDDETMSKIFTFFKDDRVQPYITKEQVERVKTLQQVAKNNNVPVIWRQAGFKKSYYYFKQFGFNGLNLLHLLNVNTQNAALASRAANGAAGFGINGAVAISWSASLLLATVENYIPNDMRKIKAVVAGAKWVSAFPIRIVEWTVNSVTNLVDPLVFGTKLPINITETYRLQIGPKVEDLPELKKSVIDWTLKVWKAKQGGN